MPAHPGFADALPVRQALQRYFDQYHFKDGGYNERWFHIKIGPLHIPMPNTKARIAAVKLHDIHHIVTEYRADWKGEVEIGAWEIASGCGRYMVAWQLNFGSFLIGLFLFPRAVYTAFLRGRRARTNLYHAIPYDDALNGSVGELRARIDTDRSLEPAAGDRLLFAGYALFSLLGVSLFVAVCFLAIRSMINA